MRPYPVLLLAAFFLFSCDQPGAKSTSASSTQPMKSDAASAALSEPAPATVAYDTSIQSVQRLKSIFRIEKRNGNGIFLQLYVYLSDTSKVEPITEYLKVRYAGQYSRTFDIWYFDKKNFVDKYLHAVDDHSLSDAAFAALDRHMICQYSWAGYGEGTFDYNRAEETK